jgi:hypothetical protein
MQWLFAEQRGGSSRLIPRWLFLRGLGLIYFSAFFSTVFQIRGLIGPGGILPAGTYLDAIAEQLGPWQKFWYAPTLLWWSNGSLSLSALCWIGMLASVLLVLNLWPRGTLLMCLACFLSFVAAAQDFSSYQSDGMLLEAGAISLFFAPPGFRPGLGAQHPASRASLFLLIWEWFRIYFESGAVKLLSGDPQWRNYTALDEYYQNGPLPTWVGWYVQHLPHWFHAATVYLTLSFELGLIWVIFLPRRWRIACCLTATLWQIGIILTANYAFLNYIVLLMGVLLLDDRLVLRIVPQRWKERVAAVLMADRQPVNPFESWTKTLRGKWHTLRFAAASAMLLWIFYVTVVELIWMFSPIRLPASPVNALEPFRIANRYGLFAVMTRGRYEIEFQGSADGQNWIAYPFRFKPQDLDKPPGIYAPYQPRFEWNLWFASLGSWRDYVIVPNTEVQLLSNAHDVVGLFARNPFPHDPPRQVRVVLWQYWFTSMAEKRATGMWWRRQMLGLYAPTLQREPDGKIRVVDWPTAPTPQ